ncbi:GDSL-type esterase/lipase family protein [Mucilaginibacter dorajii]|uniref:SGNH hydrolase-type esterase domain-containing protein n=1 Tax=Mucilaginibacter dorajii TaxID=692994 RepID=A0ABP7P9S8_9SPHI|nr:GDSL-type esterase/lipase family protein [Mucilaginibacter dorajii]MCS3735212.1 lysophospholipase L1-like esterase [Mucilaginibacter dorajii]
MAINKKLIYKYIFIISIALNVLTIGYFIDKKVLFGIESRHQFERQKWNELFSTAHDSTEIIFIGTSLTQNFRLQEEFNNPHLKNMGFGGTETPAILNNFKRIIVRKPPKIFLEGGINDVQNGLNMDDAFKNFVEMCTLAKTVSPRTKLFVQSVLPTMTSKFNERIEGYNSRIMDYCKVHNIPYINMYHDFIVDGKLNPLATIDGIHLTPYGYYLWKKHLLPYINE